MITKLSPELKSHIEEHIEEIEKDNVHNSIIRCPVNILHEYIEVLKQIDVKPSVMLNPYIDVALCVASKTAGICHCSKIELLHPDEFKFEFEIHPQNLDWGLFQKALMKACPYHYVRSNIKYELGLPMTTIQVELHPIGSFRF